MLIRDIMSQPAVSVGPETPAREIARLLLTRRISGVPVVDADNRVLGIVSDGDLLTEHLPAQQERRDWWLNVLAGGQEMSAEYVKHLEQGRSVARQLMSSPAIVIGEDDDIRAVAALFDRHKIKRAPVVRDGKLVGMATRADLLAAMARGSREAAPERPEPSIAPAPFPAPAAVRPNVAPSAADAEFSAAGFRQLAARFHQHETQLRAAARDARRQHRDAEVKALLDAPLTDKDWRAMLDEAKRAAASGLKDCVLMRFPAPLCSDGGRAVNAPDPSWPATLRGKAALVFLRWKDELQPAGFRMGARIADFPDGLPGDVELSLVWGGGETR